ncbi:hypothetical protein PM082_008896 [Marasmius tenuissimus]|nr:hypothetical protein PM082_008896 [Marasmius tenuissimus]
MLSSSEQKVVFLVGETGRTGTSIARAHARESTGWNQSATPLSQDIKAIVRSSSLDKPTIKELTSLGFKIVTGDIISESQETLESYLKDVNTVIITTVPIVEDQQDNLLRAAKAAGVERLGPSDFATFFPPGSMRYQHMSR